MSLKTYDIANVNLVVGGRTITGLADGTVIQAEKNADSFTSHVGVKGEVTLAENNDSTGTITVTVKNTSPSYPYLTQLGNRKGRNAIVPAQIVDFNENSVQAGGSEARVMRPANASWSDEETSREFQIFVADFSMR